VVSVSCYEPVRIDSKTRRVREVRKCPKTYFSLLRLGVIQLPNRIVMAPLTRMRVGAHNVSTALNAEYYALRSSAGLIISEGTAVSALAQGYPSSPGTCAREQISGWRGVTDAVHDGVVALSCRFSTMDETHIPRCCRLGRYQ
jgi:hypothetical protein